MIFKVYMIFSIIPLQIHAFCIPILLQAHVDKSKPSQCKKQRVDELSGRTVSSSQSINRSINLTRNSRSRTTGFFASSQPIAEQTDTQQHCSPDTDTICFRVDACAGG
mmetsp:Transcript_9863/g.27931  ORF Transcript_9863/g.27931 Transcript_9863/m.27931 type:complete len:108 (-) Transcript_9863:106-429(-)